MVVQKSIDLSLPQATAAKVNMETTIPISVTREGAIFVEQEPVPPEALARRLQIEKERNPKLAVVLRADADSQHKSFVFVLDQLKK